MLQCASSFTKLCYWVYGHAEGCRTASVLRLHQNSNTYMHHKFRYVWICYSMTRHYCILEHEPANGAKASEMHHVLPVPGSRSFQTGPWRAFCFDQHPAKPLRGSNGLGPCPQIQMQLCSMAQHGSMQTSFCTADLSLKMFETAASILMCA